MKDRNSRKEDGNSINSKLYGYLYNNIIIMVIYNMVVYIMLKANTAPKFIYVYTVC